MKTSEFQVNPQKHARFYELSVGTQVVYVPAHAEYDLRHPAVEFGFVTSTYTSQSPTDPSGAWCRFWLKSNPAELRNKSASELAPLRNLYLYDSVPAEQVASALAHIERELNTDKAKELAERIRQKLITEE